MDASLKIIVGADTGDVDKQLQKLERQAASLKKQLEKPINANVKITVAKELDKVNAEIAKLRQQKIDLQISGTSIQGLKNLENGANKATASLTKLKANTGAASNTILNFSRVVSDAPFGVVGIANNIEQLASGFGALKLQARESGQSIKTVLLSSLAGPAGISLAISAVTSALTFATVGFDAWTRAFKSSGDNADALKSRIDELKKSVKSVGDVRIDAIGDTAGDIANVNALSQAVLNANLPYEQRQRALEKLKKINKEYFGDLTVETAQYGALKRATEEYTKQLVSQAVVKGLQDQITANAQLRGELFKRLQLEQKEVDLAKKRDDNARRATQSSSFAAVAAGQSAAIANETQLLDNARKKANQTRQEIIDLGAEFGKIQKSIQKEVEFGLSFKTDTEDDVLDDVQKIKDKIEKNKAQLKIESDPQNIKILQTEIKKFQTQLRKLQGEKISTGTIDAVSAEEAAQKIIDIQNRLSVDLLKSQKNITKNEREEIKLRGEQRIAELKKAYDKERAEEEAKLYQNAANKKKVLDALETAFLRTVTTVRTEVLFELLDYNAKFNDFTNNLRNKVDKDIKEKPISATWPIEIQTKLKEKDKAEESAKEQLREYRKAISDTIEGGLVDTFSALGETVGNIFSGGGFLQNIAKGGEAILKVVGGVLQQLGKQVIKASVLVQALKKALANLLANPAAGLAIGVGLVALGSLLKNIKLTKIPALAEGGIVTGPTLSLIGEKGSEAVIPLDKLSGMMVAAVRAAINPSGARGLANTGDQRLVTEIRGSSLALVLQRTNQTSSRLG